MTNAEITTAFVVAVIDAAETEARRSQREISRFCIAALLAMAALWVIGAKAFYRFSVECGRCARIYCAQQLTEDIVTVVRFIPTVPGHIRRALASDELAFITVVVQSVAVLIGIAAEAVADVWAFFFGSSEAAIA